MSYNRLEPYNNLPPLSAIEIPETPAILKKLVFASRHLAELNGLCASLPDPQLLINTIVLQESQDSSAIENIVTTQDELFRAVTEQDSSNAATKEVLSYREALYAGLEKMQSQQNLLLTNTMIEIVQTIKQNQSGIRNTPGTILKSSITGDTIYTPPCCEDVLREKLSDLEQFINDQRSSQLDPLVKMAIIHYQFEAIHPFADGNGRAGRILNALYLVQQEMLTQPVLYLSSYIVKRKTDYYQLLRGVTEKENWQDWILFMLTAIAETSILSTRKIRGMLLLKENLEQQMKQVLGASFSYELLQLMFALPYLKIDLLEKKGLAHRQTASVWLKKLADAKIVQPQKTGKTTYYVNYRLMQLLSDNY